MGATITGSIEVYDPHIDEFSKQLPRSLINPILFTKDTFKYSRRQFFGEVTYGGSHTSIDPNHLPWASVNEFRSSANALSTT